jgi:hypothetical protein
MKTTRKSDSQIMLILRQASGNGQVGLSGV